VPGIQFNVSGREMHSYGISVKRHVLACPMMSSPGTSFWHVPRLHGALEGIPHQTLLRCQVSVVHCVYLYRFISLGDISN
jgi:hypothetical protein